MRKQKSAMLYSILFGVAMYGAGVAGYVSTIDSTVDKNGVCYQQAEVFCEKALQCFQGTELASFKLAYGQDAQQCITAHYEAHCLADDNAVQTEYASQAFAQAKQQNCSSFIAMHSKAKEQIDDFDLLMAKVMRPGEEIQLDAMPIYITMNEL